MTIRSVGMPASMATFSVASNLRSADVSHGSFCATGARNDWIPATTRRLRSEVREFWRIEIAGERRDVFSRRPVSVQGDHGSSSLTQRLPKQPDQSVTMRIGVHLVAPAEV
jgi:hypothetical protein